MDYSYFVGDDTSQYVEEQLEEAAGMYTCQQDLWTTHMRFPMPGKESSDALRVYLLKWGPERLSKHHEHNLRDISLDRLLDLQAVFWRETSSSYAADFSKRHNPTERRWKDNQLVAYQLDKIAHLLEFAKHVFIVEDGSMKQCANPSCQKSTPQTGRPRIITLEPLLDWVTVTPASELCIAEGGILPFRRNGVKMKDPHWAQVVRKLLSAESHKLAYCTECLQELMARRSEARSIINHHTRAVPEVQPIRKPSPKDPIYGRTQTRSSECISISLHLDGACDPPSQSPHRVGRLTQWIKRRREMACSKNLHDAPSRASDPVNWAGGSGPSQQRNSTPFTLLRDPVHVNKVSPTAGVPFNVPSPRHHRSFGRQIDTNIANNYNYKHTSGKSKMAKNKESPGSESESINNQAGKAPKSAAKSEIIDIDMNMDVDADSDSFLSDFPLDLSDNPPPSAALNPNLNPKSKGKEKAVSKTSPKNSPVFGKPPTQQSKPQPPFAPVFRKPPTPTTLHPPSVTAEAFALHLLWTPDPTEPICTCRKPARTYEVPITQCVEPGCNTVWFHKACLDKTGKLKAKFGTYLCGVCAVAREWKDNDVGNGNREGRDVQMFMKRDLEAVLPGAGGFEGVEDPYGLASMSMMGKSKEGVVSETQTQKLGKIAVGSLASLGYEVSRPWFLHQAYANRAEHVSRADWEYDADREYDGEEEDRDKESEDEDESGEDEDKENMLMQDSMDTL